jgi:hypothetical protein
MRSIAAAVAALALLSGTSALAAASTADRQQFSMRQTRTQLLLATPSHA